MLKIGQRVSPKKTGCPTVGTIIGIINSSLAQGGGYWDSLYNGWREKLVYVVQFDKPQKIMSMDEYLVYLEKQKASNPFRMPGFEGNPDQESFGEAPPDMSPNTPSNTLLNYLNDIPYAMNASYPEDDLEVF